MKRHDRGAGSRRPGADQDRREGLRYGIVIEADVGQHGCSSQDWGPVNRQAADEETGCLVDSGSGQDGAKIG